MSVEEELQEQMEKAHDPFEKHVAGSMAILAAGLAIVSVLGHLATTEEIVNQAKASDQWAYYQAKSIRRYESEIARDILAALAAIQDGRVSEERWQIHERGRRYPKRSAGAGGPRRAI